ncbi:transposase [Rhizobium wenxiniae]|uniref:Transposase n=1 Tax=Rhizobium wenxiniae TaxID=1737357 RepID=A0A7X0D1S2_9HYPH|nr:transposase [Rhizobium wenxiniae]
MRRHELSDEEWTIIAPLLPTNTRGVERVDDRRVFNGILLALQNRIVLARRAGTLWPAHDTLQSVFPLAQSRCLGCLLGAVSKCYDGDIVMIESSCVRVHQHGANAKKGAADPCMGRSRGGLTTKIHALVDADGLSVRLELPHVRRPMILWLRSC